MNMQRDRIFASPVEPSDFSFNHQVADVFTDMITRSVPGYSDLVQNIGILATNFAKDHDVIYDLGCSLGAVSKVISNYLPQSKIIAIDNSAAMIANCRANLNLTNIELLEADILKIAFVPHQFAVLNFTLQFIEPKQRLHLLQNIYQALQPSCALVLAEKIKFTDDDKQNLITNLHLNFKRQQGYSELEIAQKRTSLEKVLIPDTLEEHINRLQQAGFSKVIPWFSCLNFVSILAIK